MTSLPHVRPAPPAEAVADAAVAPRARSPLRRIVAAALCLAFVLVPASALSARPHGAATAPAAQPSGAAEDRLPPAVAAILRGSGLPAKSFAFDVRAVDGIDASSLLAFHADQPFLLASTTKVVTSLAALDLLGPRHRWRTSAFATGPVVGGRLSGDLVIVGGPVGLTGNELRRWFRQMRAEGLETISGNIVLDDVALLHERDPKQAHATERERDPDAPIDARTYNLGKLLVSVKPGAGERAVVTLEPRPANVLVVNDVFMGGGCSAWARFKTPDEIESGPPLQLWVRGRWNAECGGDDIAYVAPPARVRLEPELGSAPALPIAASRMVADLWAEAGGSLRGHVVERDVAAPRPRAGRWSSELMTPVGEVLREMNKTSNNEAARNVLLSLAPGGDDAGTGGLKVGALKAAQERMRGWLRTQGLRDGDITVVLGSGQSRAERGKPRALVDLLRTAWRGADSQTLVDSLPIAGVDGTLIHRMKSGAATGQAYLKTGTLSDTRALAGYVRAKSGRVYAVSMIVTDPAAARGTPALDSLVEWVARAG
ncbi:MAG TPA: D-alanyl-D-alanine carboxypeptidase [Caldimonas sp.]|nr:D-alanyl-D-alanine carboxypeptidase [Caldimonas sp.]